MIEIDTDLQRAVEEFLYHESDLLDGWDLKEWLGLFAPDGRYLVPATDLPDGDERRDLFLINDDPFLLEHRVLSLLTKSAHAEWPHSRTRRLVTNVRAGRRDHGDVWASANFAVYRMRRGTVDTYVGRYRHVLTEGPDGFRFVERRAILDLDALRPHGKLSIIL